MQFNPIEINDKQYFGNGSGLIYEKTNEGLPGKLVGRISFLNGKTIVSLEEYERMRNKVIHNSQRKYKEYIKSNEYYINQLDDTYSKLNKKMRSSLPDINPEFEMPENPSTMIKSKNGNFYKKNGDIIKILEPYIINSSTRKRIPINLQKVYNRTLLEKPYWEKLYTNYQEIQNQYLQLLKYLEEKTVEEETERIRIEQAKIDPIVIEEIERRYEQVFQALKEKEMLMNIGKRVSLEPGEFAEIIHIQPNTRNSKFIERYKNLSKPYYDRFMENIESLRKKQNAKGGKRKTRRSRMVKKTRKIRRSNRS